MVFESAVKPTATFRGSAYLQLGGNIMNTIIGSKGAVVPPCGTAESCNHYRPKNPTYKMSNETRQMLRGLCEKAKTELESFNPKDTLVGPGFVTQIGQYNCGDETTLNVRAYFKLLWIGNEAGDSQKEVRNGLGNTVWDDMYTSYQDLYSAYEEYVSLRPSPEKEGLLVSCSGEEVGRYITWKQFRVVASELQKVSGYAEAITAYVKRFLVIISVLRSALGK